MTAATIDTTARAYNPETAVITIESKLTPSQRASIRRVVDRRNERMSSDETFVSRERGTIVVTVTPEAVDAADEYGRAAFPSIQDVRDAAVRAAHREADAVALGAGVVFNYSVEVR